MPETSFRISLASTHPRSRPSKSLMVRFFSRDSFTVPRQLTIRLRVEGSYDARVRPLRYEHQDDDWHGFASQTLALVRPRAHIHLGSRACRLDWRRRAPGLFFFSPYPSATASKDYAFYTKKGNLTRNVIRCCLLGRKVPTWPSRMVLPSASS